MLTGTMLTATIFNTPKNNRSAQNPFNDGYIIRDLCYKDAAVQGWTTKALQS